MISKKKIIIIAAVVVAVVAVVGVFLLQSFTASFTEVEATINNFVSKVSSYDAAGAWALTSQDYQASWGEYIEFENFVNSLYEKVWHSTIQSISSRTMETKNGITTASVTLTAGITDTEQGTYMETWIFELVKIENEWKIDDWLVQD
jgi:predicted PurR-regulated permease PerM